jgi:hypothetical protein
MNRPNETTEPIDAVITWVDGSDPKLRAKQARYFDLDSTNRTISPERFIEHGEIYYCIASILTNAPFINHIYVVTDEQYPTCLEQIETDFGIDLRARISVIDHKVIFRGFEDSLPTFNSRSIESMLHRIPGLSGRYVYFNDDCFIARPMQESDFFVGNKPVLRGKWLPSITATFKDFLHRTWISKWLGISDNSAGFKEAQFRSFEYLGFRYRYFWHDHTPAPMIRETLQNFFDDNADLHRLNIGFRTRDKRQLNVTSLLRGLEIRNGAPTTREISLVYVKANQLNPEKQIAYLQRKISKLEKNRSFFICIQNLQRMEPEARDLAVRWLKQLFGKIY